jgi:hypothetical protein
MYDANRYAERLRSAGFAGVSVESIWPQVYPRFIDFARSRLREGDARNRMNPAFRAFLSVSANARKRIRPTLMDYVLVRAKKPLGAVDFTDAHVRREH